MQTEASHLRKRVVVFFLSKLEIDEYACKFVVLGLNSRQTHFEFEFPDQMQLEIDRKTYLEEQDTCEKDCLFSGFSKLIAKTQEKSPGREDYYIGITSVRIGEDDFFWIVQDNKAIITTKGWEKIFAPPSVFEYIIQSLAGVLVKMSSTVEAEKPINEHAPARGCILDDTYDKKDNKIDVSLGYICDNCKSQIKSELGPQFLTAIEEICSHKCLGDVETKGSAAYNLKKFFRVDVDKDTGFNKTLWEITKDKISRLSEAIIIAAVVAIVTAIITYYLSH